MRLTVVVLAALAIAEPVTARQAFPDEPVEAHATARLAGFGLLGGALGWPVGGVAVGAPLARWNPFGSSALDDGSWTPGLVLGLQAGQAVGIPLGVHRANGSQGDLRPSILASLAIAAVGTALLWTDDLDAVFESPRRQAVLVAVPVAQLLTSVYIERRTARRPGR